MKKPLEHLTCRCGSEARIYFDKATKRYYVQCYNCDLDIPLSEFNRIKNIKDLIE